MFNNIFYTTATVFIDGTVIEDKGLYTEGGEHAVKHCKERLLQHPEIDFIVLIPDNGITQPNIIRR